MSPQLSDPHFALLSNASIANLRDCQSLASRVYLHVMSLFVIQAVLYVIASVMDDVAMKAIPTSTPATQKQPVRSPLARSRLTNGADLLPNVDQRSTWARMFRDLCDSMAEHVGGADRMSEPQRMICRRVAALEAELVHLEARFAQQRADGGQPTATDLDLYSRISNTQRRLFESIGMDRRPRDVVPALGDYLRDKREAA